MANPCVDDDEDESGQDDEMITAETIRAFEESQDQSESASSLSNQLGMPSKRRRTN